jgi:hypothetical protein
MPGQLVPRGQPQRGVGRVAPLVQQIRARGDSLIGADASPGGQRSGLGGHQPAGSGDVDRLGRMPVGDVQVSRSLSPSGQVGQGNGEFGEVVAVPEDPGRCG